MAEIEIERRPSRNLWPWVLIALLVAALAAGAWWFLLGGADTVNAPPATETTPTGETAAPIDRDPVPLRADTTGDGSGVQVIPRPADSPAGAA